MVAFKMNEPSVVYEDFGTDSVVLNLETGAYFSLSGKMKVFFEAINAGNDPEILIQRLNEKSSTVAQEAELALSTITQSGLIVEDTDKIAEMDFDACCESILAVEGPLKVESYSDLSDVIAADPIHDL